MKPLIALSSRSTEIDNHNHIYYNNASYSTFLENAGAIVSTIKALNEKDAQQIATTFDGLLLTGGEDIDPKYFHQDNLYSDKTELIEPALDLSDFYLYNAFKKAGKPILGICRGIQVIAVAEGSSMIQDLPTEKNVQHSQSELEPKIPADQLSHLCFFNKDSQLHAIFGDHYPTNSFHHQACASVPDGFLLSAQSEDGIIEAIENKNIIGVQWHPERMIADDKHMCIAQLFIDKCLAQKTR